MREPCGENGRSSVSLSSANLCSSTQEYLQRAIPIFIPAFNNPTYVRNMVNQLRAKDLNNIFVVDDASTSPEIRSLLESDFGATIIRLQSKSNHGPRHIFMNDQSLSLLPDLFCVTDPDLELNPHLPPDFIARLVILTERFQVGKAGFSIDISDPEEMRDEVFEMGGKLYKIWEWEEQFWTNPIGELDKFGTIYRATIDTTFAVYNKKYFRPDAHMEAVRVAGVFTCRHLPWYRNSHIPRAEEEFYRATTRIPSYLSLGSPSDVHAPSSLTSPRTGRNDVLVIVPTRSRSEDCEEFAEAFFAHSRRADLLFALDEDDPQLTEYRSMPAVQYELNPRLHRVGTLNLVANKYADQYAYLAVMSDQHRIRTPGWDEQLVKSIEYLSDGIAYGNDLRWSGMPLPSTVLLRSEIVRTLGFIAPPELINYFTGHFWRHLGQALNTLRYCEGVVIEHVGPAASSTDPDAVNEETSNPEAVARDYVAFQRYIRTRLRIDASCLQSLLSASVHVFGDLSADGLQAPASDSPHFDGSENWGAQPVAGAAKSRRRRSLTRQSHVNE